MNLAHHAALRAIGGTLNKHHSSSKTEYWTLPDSLEDKPDFYNIRDKIGFDNLLCGFHEAGFIVYLDKPKITDSLIAAAPDLLAALEDAEFLLRKASQIAGPMQDSFKRSAEDALAAIAKARGEA